MGKTSLPHLEKARRQKQFIRFSHRFEHFPVRGYVMDIGPTFFLMSLVSDRLWFDGFECFRHTDVRSVEPDPYTHFSESVLKKRGERPPKKPHVSVASIQELLRTAGRVFPLVTIQRERVNPEVCWIGRILSVNGDHVSMLDINPDATWIKSRRSYRLREITRVNFGGDYENALDLVSTKCPIQRTRPG